MPNNLSPVILLIPIQLDALCLQDPIRIADRIADFSKLPFSDGTRDYNSQTPYLGQEVLSQPFINQNTLLNRGIHLHWALPDALTHGASSGDDVQFPSVPNLWLINRKRNGQIEKQWIVESNFMHSLDATIEFDYYTVMPTLDNNSPTPFRFIGRRLLYSEWLLDSSAHEYWPNLTAIGYGEPTFAALYSNCASVFGFFDPECVGTESHLEYEVIGWYSDLRDDALYKFLQNEPYGTPLDFKESLQNYFSWVYKDSETIPEQLVCYAKLGFSPNTQNSETSDVDIVVGNTIAETLSTLLANKLSPGNPNQIKLIEQQLNAISLLSNIEKQQLDLEAKFKEAQHQSGFTAVKSGSIWTVRYRQQASSPTDPGNDATQVTLPSPMADLLNELNILQENYDRLSDQINELGARLFIDWYKFMTSCYPPQEQRNDYPDSDTISTYIKTVDFFSLDHAQDLRGNVTVYSSSARNSPAIRFNADGANTVAYDLANTGNELLESIQRYNQDKAPSDQLILIATQAPRYWQANDPVALLTGPDAIRTSRHGLDGVLTGHVLQFNQNETLANQLTIISQQMDLFPEDDAGFSTWSRQPWNPFLLEWKALFFPQQNGRDVTLGTYQPQYITANYQLPDNAVDFVATNPSSPIDQDTNSCSNMTILTSSLGEDFNTQLQNYLTKSVLSDYYSSNQIPVEQQTDDYLQKNIDAIVDWYKVTYPTQCNYENPTYTALVAYQLLQTISYLAQSLAGFNQALLMRKEGLQLAITDPLISDPSFAQQVASRADEHAKRSPLPMLDFNPMRAGYLKLAEMNLIDTFGQVRTLNVNRLFSSSLLPLDSNGCMQMQPRITQASRINVRWLSASSDKEEMNEHVASTPICGWLLPNHLDNNILVYTTDGTSLGAITTNTQKRWQSNPGDPNPKSIEQITNVHLQSVVQFLIEQGPDYLDAFMKTLFSALENIEPETYAQSLGVSVLVGRPIAVTRIKIDLQLKGLPAYHQGWNFFRQDLHRNFRETYNFPNIEIPVRIGEYKQLNDGVIGYWIERQNSYANDTFYAPQSDIKYHDKIISHNDQPLNLQQSIQQEPTYLTVLFDPRGVLHATTAILPTKALTIPPDQFTPFFQNIDISFLTTPILMGSSFKIPLPLEANSRWSWIEKQATGYWREVSTVGTVHKEQLNAAFTNGTAIWDTLLREDIGWLKLATEDHSQVALIVPVDQRPSNTLGEIDDQKQMIEAFLQECYLQTSISKTFTSEKMAIKEGWLTLRKQSE